MEFITPTRFGLVQGYTDEITGKQFVSTSPSRAELEQLKMNALASAHDAAEQVIERYGNRGRSIERFALEWRMLAAERAEAAEQ